MKEKLRHYSGYLRRRRRDFVLKEMPSDSICCEIGVDEGDFSKEILKKVKPKKLFLIDPWRYHESEIYQNSLYGGKSGMNQNNMEKRYQNILNRFRLEIENGQVVIERNYSEKALIKFPDEYFDWFYLDGNHLYEFVKKDLDMCYIKLKKGGFLTGDDYGVHGWWENGVQKAVDEFVSKGLVKLEKVKHDQYILRKS